VPSYWINHPTETGFISATSPEGVAQLLMLDVRWPAGLYVVNEYRQASPPSDEHYRRWGTATKRPDGQCTLDPDP
jgi:hypothetical protein